MGKSKKINLLPGPVYILDKVIRKFERVPISHRAEDFLSDLNKVKQMLCKLTKAKKVEICLGSGTLANDLIGAQLYLINKKGIVLSNGEFGERLIDHAKRFNLDIKILKYKWGEAFDYNEIESLLKSNKYKWIWFVHHETSTGMLNDFKLLNKIARKHKKIICVDCISSIGAVDLDLSKVDFASGTSGKAIASYPGLSFVFYKKIYSSSSRNIPRYLDLRLYKKSNGVPFTSSSNLLSALKTALQYILKDKNRFKKIENQTKWIRENIKKINIPILVNGELSSPIIITLHLPKKIKSSSLGKKLMDMGYQVHYQSSYLRRKNWVQISSMSLYKREQLKPLFEIINSAIKNAR